MPTDIICDKTHEVKRVAIYIRVSSDKQVEHGCSLADQEQDLRGWISAHNHILVDVYADEGISARSRYTKRPAMMRLIDDCKNGKIDLIIVTKLDRLFRNIASFYEVISILEENNVKWMTTREDYETLTASGRLKINIMLAVAQDEADRTSERIKAVFEYKRASGEYTGGHPPFGYIRTEDGLIIKDPEREDLTNRIFELYLLYGSSVKVADAVGMKYQRIHYMIRNETYYTGYHRDIPVEPYLTKEQWERIKQHRANNTRTPKQKGNIYIFAGLIKCGVCGRNYVSKIAAGTKRYQCCSQQQRVSCGNKGMREIDVERLLLEDITDAMNTATIHVPKIKPPQRSIKPLKEKLSRLTELYIDGDISKKIYTERKEALERQISEIESTATEIKKAPDLPDNWRAIYDGLTEESKQIWWRNVIASATVTGQKFELVFP